MAPLTGLVLALLSLVAWTAAAQPLPERTLRVRRVPLTGTAVDVRVAPDIPTTLNFDADIDMRSVALGDEGRIKLMSVAARAITLMPIAELGATVELRARFADACVALEPRFSLRTDAAEVDTQVTAYRDARAPELLRAQVAELEARNTACTTEVAALRARSRATGPAALVLSGQLGPGGVQVDTIRCDAGTGADAVRCSPSHRFLSKKWVVVSATLLNPPGQPVWKPGGAWLVGESSRERIAARVVALEPEVLAPATTGRVAVEFHRPPRRPSEVYRVEVREAEGTRHLSFPHMNMDAPNTDAPEKAAP